MTPTMTAQPVFPKLISNEQFDLIQQDPEFLRFGKRCPTCGGGLGEHGPEEGTYRHKGEEHICPVDRKGHTQLRMFQNYRLANIHYQYMILDWADYPESEAKANLDAYIAGYEQYRRTGMGWLIHGGLGVGKSWAAIHVLKEVLKQGHSGYWMDFRQMMNLRDETSQENYARLFRLITNVELAVIDEVVPPFSDAAHGIYSDRLETFVRARTNANMPTIVTTNMTVEAFEETYPRVWSLLYPKTYEMHVRGVDARSAKGRVFDANSDLASIGEVAPIT